MITSLRDEIHNLLTRLELHFGHAVTNALLERFLTAPYIHEVLNGILDYFEDPRSSALLDVDGHLLTFIRDALNGYRVAQPFGEGTSITIGQSAPSEGDAAAASGAGGRGERRAEPSS